MIDAEWLEHDEVRVDALPDWARAAHVQGPAVRLTEHGLLVCGSERASVASWQDIFGVAVLAPSARWLPQAFVLAPRRPPHPPWFAVAPGMLPPELRSAGIAGFTEQVRQRISPWGYRSARAERPRLAPEEVLERVLARDALPGAVEVPVGPPPDPTQGGWSRAAGVVSLAGGSAFITGYFGLIAGGLLGAVLVQPWLAALALPAAALGGAVGLGVGVKGTKRSEARVLVMTPDACVVGFYHGIRALAWGTIAAFRAGTFWRPDLGRGSPALEVVGLNDEPIGFVESHWFAEPLELVVAVGEAYRRRVAAGSGVAMPPIDPAPSIDPVAPIESKP